MPRTIISLQDIFNKFQDNGSVGWTQTELETVFGIARNRLGRLFSGPGLIKKPDGRYVTVTKDYNDWLAIIGAVYTEDATVVLSTKVASAEIAASKLPTGKLEITIPRDFIAAVKLVDTFDKEGKLLQVIQQLDEASFTRFYQRFANNTWPDKPEDMFENVQLLYALFTYALQHYTKMLADDRIKDPDLKDLI